MLIQNNSTKLILLICVYTRHNKFNPFCYRQLAFQRPQIIRDFRIKKKRQDKIKKTRSNPKNNNKMLKTHLC